MLAGVFYFQRGGGKREIGGIWGVMTRCEKQKVHCGRGKEPTTSVGMGILFYVKMVSDTAGLEGRESNI